MKQRELRTLKADTKTIGLETREDGTTTLSGHAAVFYRADEPGTQYELWSGAVERIERTAFDAAIERDDVRALFNHDSNYPLGRTSSKTLKLSVDERGLKFSVDLPDTQAGRDVAESVRRGDVSGASFGFVVTDQEWRTEDGMDVRSIAGVELYDVGPVTFPAFEATDVSVRSDEDVEAAKAAHEAFKSARGDEESLRQKRKANSAMRVIEISEQSGI